MNISTIGFIAAICTTTSFLPQVFKTWKTKRTKDISLPTYTILTTGVLLWTLYGMFTHDMPVFISNGLTFIFVLPILYMKVKHG